MSETEAPKTCCPMRTKVILILGPKIEESVCGISDSVLADYLRWDLEGPKGPDGRPKPVLGIHFCPWCGTKIEHKSAVRITGTMQPGEDPHEEGWRNGIPPVQ